MDSETHIIPQLVSIKTIDGCSISSALWTWGKGQWEGTAPSDIYFPPSNASQSSTFLWQASNFITIIICKLKLHSFSFFSFMQRIMACKYFPWPRGRVWILRKTLTFWCFMIQPVRVSWGIKVYCETHKHTHPPRGIKHEGGESTCGRSLNGFPTTFPPLWLKGSWKEVSKWKRVPEGAPGALEPKKRAFWLGRNN